MNEQQTQGSEADAVGAPAHRNVRPSLPEREAAAMYAELRAAGYTWKQAHDVMDRVAAERERWAHVLDGWRVLQSLTPEQRKRIGYADVSDVLDAVARLSRA